MHMIKKWGCIASIFLGLTALSAQATPVQKEILPDGGVCLRQMFESRFFESKIEMCYPTLNNPKAQAVIETWSKKGMQESLKMSREYAQTLSELDAFEKKCRDGKAENAEMYRWTCKQGKVTGGRQTWEFSNHYTLAYASPRYVSVVMMPWAFTGGAHGNGIFDAMNFDLKTGNLLKLTDIFPTKESLEKAAVLLEDRFRAMPHVADYTKKPAIQAENLKINQIALTPEGLNVLFAPYELAPYAYGSYTLPLTRSELMDIGANMNLWLWKN